MADLIKTELTKGAAPEEKVSEEKAPKAKASKVKAPKEKAPKLTKDKASKDAETASAPAEAVVSNKAATALRNLDDEELLTKLREAKEELFNLRFQAATGQLESHGRLRAIKKEIARIYTTMRERELGITSVEGVA